NERSQERCRCAAAHAKHAPTGILQPAIDRLCSLRFHRLVQRVECVQHRRSVIAVAADRIQPGQVLVLLPDLLARFGEHTLDPRDVDSVTHSLAKKGASAGASHSSISSLSSRAIIIWNPACSWVVMNSPTALRTR